MKAVFVKPVRIRSDGKQVVNAVIAADSTPATLPTTGENIEGMSADMVFAPMSVLYVVGTADGKVYLADESGTFQPQ